MTPGTIPVEKAPYNPHWKFDKKVSLDTNFKYDSKDTAVWLKKVGNYFIGQCPDSAILLKWAIGHGHEEITQADVKATVGSLCLDADPVQVSQGIWSWLQIPLLGSGTP